MPGQSTGLWESVKIHRSNKKDTEMIPARGKLFLGGAAVWLGMLFLLGALSRDAYTTWAMTLWVKVPCALLAGGACLWLLRDQRPPLANPLRHWVGCFVFGATTFGMMVAFAFDTLVRFTASQPHVGQAGYTITSGSKSCRYGVSFDDPVLQEQIDFCGPRWQIPKTPTTGVLHITERSGRFGVVLVQVTSGN